MTRHVRVYTSSLVSRPQCKRYCVFCSLAVLSIKYSKERNWISLIPYFQLRLMLFGDGKIRYSGRVEMILNVNVNSEMSQVIVRDGGKMSRIWMVYAIKNPGLEFCAIKNP